MSLPSIPPQYVPAPVPPAAPPLHPDTHAPHATGGEVAYTDKQLLDLQMRKQFPGLWSAAQAQSKQLKKEARKEAATSLATEPKMVQQSRASEDRIEWVDLALPLFDPRSQGKLARAAENGEQAWPPSSCGDRYFSEYKETMESFGPLSYQLVGGDDPNSTCIAQLPEFIICSDDQLETTFYDPFNWPRQILDYRNISALWDEDGIKGSCALFWKIACPEPATTPEGINRQIDETLQKDAGTRTYLNQTQLDAYLDWRKANGNAKDFKYILVRDKQPQVSPAPGNAAPENSGAGANGNGGVLGIFAAIAAAILALGGAGALYLNRRSSQGAAPSVTTAVPPTPSGSTSGPASAAVHTVSPSSMASASTTGSHSGAAPQPSPSTTTLAIPSALPSRSSDSDDASGIGASTVTLDIPPAGQEDDA